MIPRYGRVRGKLKEFKKCKDCWKSYRPETRKENSASCDAVESLFHCISSTELDERPESTQEVAALKRGETKRGRSAMAIKDHYIFDGTLG